MELVGKIVKIHLTTPLISVDSYGGIYTVQGKILDKISGGFLMDVQVIEPKKEGTKFLYSTIFIPSHKIDFFGVIS